MAKYRQINVTQRSTMPGLAKPLSILIEKVA
jgi:hypothetical protein